VAKEFTILRSNANGAVLTFSPLQWNAFAASVRGGLEIYTE
jgi:hypothetical protein